MNIWRKYVFETQKQDRQFFTLVFSAMLIGIGWSVYLDHSEYEIKIFSGVVIGSALIIMAMTMLELHYEGKNQKESYKLDSS